MPESAQKFWDLNWKKLKTGSAAELCIHRHPMKSPQNFFGSRLADAKEKGQDLITVCSACHHVIKRVNDDMANVEDIQTKVNNYMALSEPYLGETKVLHYLEVLRDVVGFDKIKEKVVNPLKGRKIGAYYGCMLLRPSTTMQFDDPENPTIIEDFIKALGATPVVYPMRNECCGGYISLKEKKMASNMVDRSWHPHPTKEQKN